MDHTSVIFIDKVKAFIVDQLLRNGNLREIALFLGAEEGTSLTLEIRAVQKAAVEVEAMHTVRLGADRILVYQQSLLSAVFTLLFSVSHIEHLVNLSYKNQFHSRLHGAKVPLPRRVSDPFGRRQPVRTSGGQLR